MPSSPQTVTTVLVFDYEFGVDGKPLVKAAIEVSLQYEQATLASPAVILESVKQTTTTDSNGYWQVALVQNSAISPANTVYLVKTPYRSFLVAVPSGAGPFQASAIAVGVVLPLLPAGPYLAGGVFFGGSGGAVGQDTPNLFWDVTNHRLGIGTNSPQGLLHVWDQISGQGVLYVDRTVVNVNGHLLNHQTTSPTLGALQAGISVQSVVAGSTDTRGRISITTTGAPPGAGAVLALVSFATAYGSIPFIVAVNSSGFSLTFGPYLPATTGFSLYNSSTVALAAVTTYTIDYIVIG